MPFRELNAQRFGVVITQNTALRAGMYPDCAFPLPGVLTFGRQRAKEETVDGRRDVVSGAC